MSIAILTTTALELSPQERSDWYKDVPVSLHFDNHSLPLGRGETAESLASKLRGLPIGLLQVSARDGFYTYPTRFGIQRPDAGNWDTPAVWGQVAHKLGVRFGIYLNVQNDNLTLTNPQWLRVDKNGMPGKMLCMRPGVDGKGNLESVQIPVARELIERYHPDMLWFDGDWDTPLVDYCENCRKAWRNATGDPDPPKDASDPRWAHWVSFEDTRFDEYRKLLAAAIHAADPKCMYVSNWSWANSYRDPRQPPDWVGALSGDNGAGSSQGSLSATRFSALMLSPQEHLPYDVMSAVYAKPARTLPRMLQEGGLALSSGATWFLWIDRYVGEDLSNARTASQFAIDRRAAVTRTQSANPVAVLLSEDTWRESRAKGNFDWKTSRDLAFALQDKAYAVDIVDEAELLDHREQYKAVFAINQTVLGESVRRMRLLHSMDEIELPPTVKVEPVAGNPQLVFALRVKGPTTILHVTDLTSFAKGKRVEPDSTAAIDPTPTLTEVKASILYPSKPRKVTAVPGDTSISYEWREGRLYLTFRNLKVHAAALIEP